MQGKHLVDNPVPDLRHGPYHVIDRGHRRVQTCDVIRDEIKTLTDILYFFGRGSGLTQEGDFKYLF